MGSVVLVNHIYAITKYVSDAKKILSGIGTKIELGSDFDLFCSIPELQTDRHAISPIFDPTESSISASNAFWLIGREASGEIVLTQATKPVLL